MKAIIWTAYGSPDVLQLKEVEKPAPKNNEVLIKIATTAVTASDCIIRSFKFRRWPPKRLLFSALAGLMFGISKPRKPILGLVLSGKIEAVGQTVKKFQPGDSVYGVTGLRGGAYAEYTGLPQNAVLTLKPANLNDEQAAAVPYGGLIASHYLRKGNLRSGQKVLIYGASGAIGTAAVQLAKHFGADVTGVCSSTNLDLVKSLGADAVIDYTKEDFTQSGIHYDLILDAVGQRKSRERASKALCQKALTPNGLYVSVDDGIPKMQLDDLIVLKELAEAGQLKPVIDRCYPLEQMVEAHRYVDLGHKKGNVVITV